MIEFLTQRILTLGELFLVIVAQFGLKQPLIISILK